MSRFTDRTDAGRRLARLLHAWRGERAVVLGLPRGGVPVAWEVARTLDLPLDVVVVRKLGAPGNPELGMGAIAEGGERYLDPSVIRSVGASAAEVEAITARERAELHRRVERFRGGRPPLPLSGMAALVVDDGVATGGTAIAALRAVRARAPSRVVLAVPVAPHRSLVALRDEADDVVCVDPVDVLWAVGAYYDDFAQVDDDAVTDILALARARRGDVDQPPWPAPVPPAAP
jgi:putative phosphoribosyl transferase